MSQEHWDQIYATTDASRLGWYEPVPSTLGLVTAYSAPDDPVIDVGGGLAPLTAELIELGYRDLTVLDISERALNASKEALSDHGDLVRWVHADVTTFRPDRRWRLWHDRAVFHFLVDADDRDAYRAVASAAVEAGGTLVVAAFATDGPERCAGLPVSRYDVDGLAAQFTPDFDPIEGRRLTRTTRTTRDGDQRPYVGVALRRVG
jgi:SAM-dependent methyltransferase